LSYSDVLINVRSSRGNIFVRLFFLFPLRLSDASTLLRLGFAMDYPANSHRDSSMKASDEKDRVEPFPDTTLTDSAPKVTQVLSRKLLTWSVEERGAYLVSDLEFIP